MTRRWTRICRTQAPGSGSARGDRERQAAGAVPAIVNKNGDAMVGVEACAAGPSDAGVKSRRSNSSPPRAFGPDHRTRRLGATPRLPRAWPGRAECRGQRLANTVPPTDFARRRGILARLISIRNALNSTHRKRVSRQRRCRGKRACCASRRWAYGLRSTISAPAIRACCSAPLSVRQAQDRPQLVLSIEKAADAAAIVHAVVSLRVVSA